MLLLLLLSFSHWFMCDSFCGPHGLQPIRLLCPRDFSRQEYWSGLPFPSSWDLPDPGTETGSPAWAGVFFFYHWATREAQTVRCLWAMQFLPWLRFKLRLLRSQESYPLYNRTAIANLPIPPWQTVRASPLVTIINDSVMNILISKTSSLYVISSSAMELLGHRVRAC